MKSAFNGIEEPLKAATKAALLRFPNLGELNEYELAAGYKKQITIARSLPPTSTRTYEAGEHKKSVPSQCRLPSPWL